MVQTGVLGRIMPTAAMTRSAPACRTYCDRRPMRGARAAVRVAGPWSRTESWYGNRSFLVALRSTGTMCLPR